MILFKDGLKFRGIYVHSLDNDQVILVSFVFISEKPPTVRFTVNIVFVIQACPPMTRGNSALTVNTSFAGT